MNRGQFFSGIKRLWASRTRVQAVFINGLQVCAQQVRGYSARAQSGFMSGVQQSKNGLRTLCKRLGGTSIRARDGLRNGFYAFGSRTQAGSRHFLAYAGRFQKGFIFWIYLGKNGLSSMSKNLMVIAARSGIKVTSGLKSLRYMMLVAFTLSIKSLQAVGYRLQADAHGLARAGARVFSSFKVMGSGVLSGFALCLKLLQTLGSNVQAGFVIALSNGFWATRSCLLKVMQWLRSCSLAMGNGAYMSAHALLNGCDYFYKLAFRVHAGFIYILQKKFLTPRAYRAYAIIGAIITLSAMAYYYRGFVTSSVTNLKQLDQALVSAENGLNREVVKTMVDQVQACLTSNVAHVEELEERLIVQEQLLANKIDESMREVSGQTAQQVEELEEKLTVQEQILNNKVDESMREVSGQTAQQVEELEEKLIVQEQMLDNKVAQSMSQVSGQTAQQVKELEEKLTLQEQILTNKVDQSMKQVPEQINELDRKISGELRASMAMSAQATDRISGLEAELTKKKQILDNKAIHRIENMVEQKIKGLETKYNKQDRAFDKKLEAKMSGHEQALEKIEHLELKMSCQEQINELNNKMQSKFEACLTTTVQQLKGLEEKLSAHAQRIEQTKSKPDSREIVVEQTIKDEVSEQLSLLRYKLKEQEKKQKRKQMFDRFLNQLVGDDED